MNESRKSFNILFQIVPKFSREKWRHARGYHGDRAVRQEVSVALVGWVDVIEQIMDLKMSYFTLL